MRVITVNDNRKTKVGVSLPLNGNSVFNVTYSNREQIKSNLTNFILTRKGEKLFKLDFGTNIHSRLFEPLVKFNNLSNELREDINKYFINSIDLIDVSIDSDENNHEVLITIEYRLINENEIDTINIIL